MSRYVESTEDGGTIEYGFDNPLNGQPGYFADLFDAEGEHVKGLDTRDLMLLPGQRQAGKNEIADFMENHGVPEEHVEKVRMDLQF